MDNLINSAELNNYDMLISKCIIATKVSVLLHLASYSSDTKRIKNKNFKL